MILGYARISTNYDKQSIDRQIDQLREAGCEKIFQEAASGGKKDRKELTRLLDQVRENDVILISDLTRLSRRKKDIFEFIEYISSKGAKIKSLKESWLDTSTPMGDFLLTVFSGLSQLEVELTKERVLEGLKASRARGKSGGRPKVDKKAIEKAIKLYNTKEFTIQEIKEQTGVSKATLYRYLKE